MSSQPSTPKPTATTSPVVSTQQEVVSDAHHYPPSPPLPLESQKYDGVTPIQARKSRKESYTDQCPSFGPVMYLQNVFSLDRHSCVDVRLYTKVDRGFFLADNDWTCYRRNYFQVSGSFSLEGIGVLYEGQEYPCYVKTSTGQLEEIDCFMLGVSAKLSDCDKGVPLVQHTPKRDKGPQITPLPKPIRPGGNLGFSAVGSGQTIATFERLQFKTATANNGKRRAAQQYYVVVMELLAKLKTGPVVTVATTTSSSMVVRGRSPGHYAETDSAIPRASRTSSDMSNYYARPGGSYHPSDMFQPSEYIPYEYNYSSFPPPPPPPPPQSSAPSTPHTIVPPSQQSQSTYFENHERHPEYPHQHQNYNESSRKDGAHPSPYYWQRSEETSTQESWNRFRMPSNNSTLTSTNSNHSAMTPTAMTPSNSNMTTNHSAMTTNHSAMTTNHSAMTTNHSAMTTNHSAMTTNHSAMTTNHSAMAPNHSTVTSNHSTVTSNHSTVDHSQGPGSYANQEQSYYSHSYGHPSAPYSSLPPPVPDHYPGYNNGPYDWRPKYNNNGLNYYDNRRPEYLRLPSEPLHRESTTK